jgi:hypothetical protein
MPESTNISLPKTMPITKRIMEANKHISKWIKSLETPFDGDKDDIRLIKCERHDEEFSYYYRVAREVKAGKRKR